MTITIPRTATPVETTTRGIRGTVRLRPEIIRTGSTVPATGMTTARCRGDTMSATATVAVGSPGATWSARVAAPETRMMVTVRYDPFVSKETIRL